jgi:4-hydroxybenzoate polyprenyltransferase
MSVNIALMMTYLYTVHFKPITLMKNVVCATLIALSPWTSGSSTLYLLQQHYNVNIVGAGSHSLTSVLRGGVWAIPSLWRLFGILFTGVLGREILMDCNDIVADRASGIRTIPVVYGSQIASYVAALATGIMTYLAIASPLQQLLSWSSSVANVAAPIWTTVPFRRLVLAGLGCVIQLNSMLKILRTKGTNKFVIEQMIQQNLYTVVLLMASFV